MLAWLDDARRDPETAPVVGDCGKCLASQDRATRQALGCGFEPPAPAGIDVTPWDHDRRSPELGELDDDGNPTMPICPGYVCTLPTVREIARAHVHWSKGELEAFNRGESASDGQLEGLELLERCINQFIIASRRKDDES